MTSLEIIAEEEFIYSCVTLHISQVALSLMKQTVEKYRVFNRNASKQYLLQNWLSTHFEKQSEYTYAYTYAYTFKVNHGLSSQQKVIKYYCQQLSYICSGQAEQWVRIPESQKIFKKHIGQCICLSTHCLFNPLSNLNGCLQMLILH